MKCQKLNSMQNSRYISLTSIWFLLCIWNFNWMVEWWQFIQPTLNETLRIPPNNFILTFHTAVVHMNIFLNSRTRITKHWVIRIDNARLLSFTNVSHYFLRFFCLAINNAAVTASENDIHLHSSVRGKSKIQSSFHYIHCSL